MWQAAISIALCGAAITFALLAVARAIQGLYQRFDAFHILLLNLSEKPLHVVHEEMKPAKRSGPSPWLQKEREKARARKERRKGDA